MCRRFMVIEVIVALGLVTSIASAAVEKLSEADRIFMTKAAQDNLFEVRSGELAQKKTESDDVRKLAIRMVVDHSANNVELKKLAEKHDVELPNQPDEKQRKQLERLEKLSGAEFDRTYVELLIEDHKVAIALFEKHADSNTADLKQFVEKTLPVLREHLKLAEEAQKKLK